MWSDVQVNDGGWHEVKAQFNPSYMEVTVDGVKKFHRPELRQNRHIDLSGLLYFGGIEATKRSRAVSQGVTAAQAAPMGQLGMYGYRVTPIPTFGSEMHSRVRTIAI